MIGKTNAISGVSEPVPKIRTVSGSVISISNALAMPAVSLVADIDAVQNLNGYDSPWAGGSGVNKFDESSVEYGHWISGSGSESTTASYGCVSDYYPASGNIGVKCFGNTPYSFSIVEYDSAKTFIRRNHFTSLSEGSVIAHQNTAYIRFQVACGGTTSYTMTPEILAGYNVVLYFGSTAPASYSPYSNICPISGHTAVTVTRCGKNLIDDTLRYVASELTVYIGAENSGYHIPLKAGTYTFSADIGESYAAYYREENDGTGTSLWATGSALRSKTFTVSEDGLYRFWFYRSQANGGVDPTKIIHVQVESGSTPSSYEPYTSNTYTIQLGQTVYGGSIDVTNGVLTKAPYYDPYNGETLVGPWVSSMDKYVSGATPTTGAQVVDLGGTGTDVQLTATEVQMLLGSNTLWADSGDSELQYWARR